MNSSSAEDRSRSSTVAPETPTPAGLRRETRVFICYRRRDAAAAAGLATLIEQQDDLSTTVFFDQKDRISRTVWKARLRAEIDSCNVFLVLFSARLLISRHCWREILHVLRQNLARPPDGKRLIVPILLDKTWPGLTPCGAFEAVAIPAGDCARHAQDPVSPALRLLLDKIADFDRIRRSPEYVARFSGIAGFVRYALWWPSLVLTVMCGTWVAAGSILAWLLWMTFLFADGRASTVRDFPFEKLRRPAPASGSLRELTVSTPVSCGASLVVFFGVPMPAPRGFCVQTDPVLIDVATRKVYASLRFFTGLTATSAVPLCSFPNSGFAPWIWFEFWTPTQQGSRLIGAYSLFEGILPPTYGVERRVALELDEAAQAFAADYKAGPHHTFFRADLDTISASADRVSVRIPRSWCMPPGYPSFDRAFSRVFGR